MSISKKNLLINEQIREKEIRVIDADGSQLGIISSREALEKAAQRDLDLVMISPNATPPVCKIMDYGKYRFEQMKREKEAKKKQKVIEIKEVRMGLNIDTHDLQTKASQAIKFLKGGDKVKVSVRFRGREMAHQELGADLLKRFVEMCGEAANVDKPANMDGRSLAMFLTAKTSK